GIKLTKSLGQNFLHDANQLRRIVAAAELSNSDKVLEIGPGLGSLTEVLLREAGQVLAIEKDARLVQHLNSYFKERPTSERNVQPGLQQAPRERRFPTLTLIQDDALDFLRREQRDWSDWKLVANLPYSVASP